MQICKLARLPFEEASRQHESGMAASHHNGILARKVAPLVFEGFASGVNAQAQALCESVTQLLATKCRSFHTG